MLVIFFYNSLCCRYEYNVDKQMVQLKFVDRNEKGIGMLTWFAVHPTSMNNTNHLVSSDNVGYASVLFEKKFNPEGTIIGKVSTALSLKKTR